MTFSLIKKGIELLNTTVLQSFDQEIETLFRENIYHCQEMVVSWAYLAYSSDTKNMLLFMNNDIKKLYFSFKSHRASIGRQITERYTKIEPKLDISLCTIS